MCHTKNGLLRLGDYNRDGRCDLDDYAALQIMDSHPGFAAKGHGGWVELFGHVTEATLYMRSATVTISSLRGWPIMSVTFREPVKVVVRPDKREVDNE
jgi:hypothetical protein